MRLKELTLNKFKGKYHVSLSFLTGRMIESHSFDSRVEAKKKMKELKCLWLNDLILEVSFW